MSKTVLGVEYRHHDFMAYVKVGGRTDNSAERAAKHFNTVIGERLPKAQQYPPRAKGPDDKGVFIYEVPVGIDECVEEAKALLAEATLSGSV